MDNEAPQNRRFDASGFTLVEILVVVAILAILAGIVLPVAHQVLARGKETSCLSNLRQLGFATRLYSDENSGYLPPFTNDLDLLLVHDASYVVGDPDNARDPLALKAALAPYVKDPNIWYCPLDPDARMTVVRGSIDHLLTSYTFAHYTPGDTQILWPVVVRADSSEIQAAILIQDANELPIPSQIGPFSNHPDDTVNTIWGDLSAHTYTIERIFPRTQ